MTITLEQMRIVADNGHILIISCLLEKYETIPHWRVAYSYDGVNAYVLKDWLKNKPNKKQIATYLDQI